MLVIALQQRNRVCSVRSEKQSHRDEEAAPGSTARTPEPLAVIPLLSAVRCAT
jgi:hypothetical protein